jgi:hypothetical protein
MKLNLSKLNAAIDGSFKTVVEAYADQCRIEIETEQWRWDGYTLRRNGDLVGSPRDIVDEGELRDSQQDPVYGDGVAVIEWSADHAIDVHNGEPGKAARPWTKTAAEETDFEGIMARELRKRLK